MLKDTIIEHDVCQDIVFERLDGNVVRFRSAHGDKQMFFDILILTLEQAKRIEEAYEKALEQYELRKRTGMVAGAGSYKLA